VVVPLPVRDPRRNGKKAFRETESPFRGKRGSPLRDVNASLNRSATNLRGRPSNTQKARWGEWEKKKCPDHQKSRCVVEENVCKRGGKRERRGGFVAEPVLVETLKRPTSTLKSEKKKKSRNKGEFPQPDQTRENPKRPAQQSEVEPRTNLVGRDLNRFQTTLALQSHLKKGAVRRRPAGNSKKMQISTPIPKGKSAERSSPAGPNG